MSFRLSPAWWPVLAVASPLIAPKLFVRNRGFRKEREMVLKRNRERINEATPMDLPELESLELTVLVEWKTVEGFIGDAGVSYLFKSNLGSLLYDVGFGPTRPAFSHNAEKLGFHLDQVDALAISHLHGDHMGGLAAQRSGQLAVPDRFMPSRPITCYLPDKAGANGFTAHVVDKPCLLTAGIASTGPLARSLFLMGYTEEQALVARIKGKGLVVITGCGHPTIEVVLDMVRHLSGERLFAIAGGLHFPVTAGRGNRAGIQFQTIIGTGKPPWQRITDEDLSRTIDSINRAQPQRVFLSGHDTCDHALERMTNELAADTQMLKAGATIRF